MLELRPSRCVRIFVCVCFVIVGSETVHAGGAGRGKGELGLQTASVAESMQDIGQYVRNDAVDGFFTFLENAFFAAPVVSEGKNAYDVADTAADETVRHAEEVRPRISDGVDQAIDRYTNNGETPVNDPQVLEEIQLNARTYAWSGFNPLSAKEVDQAVVNRLEERGLAEW